jgi:hypothetical protein
MATAADTVMEPNDWGTLVESVRSGECVVFLGAGASTVPDGVVGLPTGGKLAEQLAEICMYRGPDRRDFLRVCQYFELVRDGQQLRKAIAKRLSIPGLQPGKLHSLIASLPVKCVLTTNYDRLMETAFQIRGKRPRVAVYDIFGKKDDLGPISEEEPLVYKLHGSVDYLPSMLCTEDDIIEFLARVIAGDIGLPPTIKQMFSSTMLFIGYGLKDWNIRALMRAMRQRANREWVRSFALQFHTTASETEKADWEHTVMYWGRKENVRCVNTDAIEFVECLVKLCES